MTMKRIFPLMMLLAGLVPATGLAGLMLGEPAPPLKVQEWVKGQPVAIKPGTNLYVVEIWESGNPACRACITNLNHLQQRYQSNGVVVVGISDEPVAKLKDFVQTNGANLDYAVAADDHRKTAISYMEPVRQRGIPFAFVVGTNGTVIWYGPPFGGLNAALHLMVAGEYDVARAKTNEIASHQMEQYLILAGRGDPRTRAAGEALLANRTNNAEMLGEMAYEICTNPRLKKRDFAVAEAALDQAEKLAGTNKAPAMIMRAVWLFASGQRDGGLLLATQALAAAKSPKERDDVQLFLRSMQAQEAEAQARASKTNGVQSGGGNTNRPSAAPGAP